MTRLFPVALFSAGIASIGLIGYALIKNEKQIEERVLELELQLKRKLLLTDQ